MKKVLGGLAAGALAMGIFASTSFAAVTYDSTTGTGFVGKGDVQQALGLNNAQMQAQAGGLEFTYVSVDTYEITVEWTTGEGTKGYKVHTVDHVRSKTFNSGVSYEARKANQVNGFNLTGFKGETAEGFVPEVGQVFPGSSGHIITEFTKVSSTSTLYVNGAALQ